MRCTYLTIRFEFETFSCFFIDFFVCRLVCLKPLARKKHSQLTHHYQLGEHRISGVYIFKAGGIVDRLVDRCARDLLFVGSNPVWHCTYSYSIIACWHLVASKVFFWALCPSSLSLLSSSGSRKRFKE